MTALGTITFRRRDGDEVYAIESASLTVTRQESGYSLFFYVNTVKGALQPVSDDARQFQPNAEVIVFAPRFDEAELVGQRFLVPEAYDKEQEDHVATIYYHEHDDDLNENVVEIVEREGNRLKVRWTALGPYLDFYDGSAPAQVIVEGWFNIERHEPRDTDGAKSNWV